MKICRIRQYIGVVALALIFTCLLSSVSYSQSGCTDPQANNYSPMAAINDGSCTYNNTLYTPPVKVDPLNAIIPETSGLQWAGGFLWTFNDSGGEPAIYRIDTASNKILQTVNLDRAANVDWEDIAFDGSNFYVGDFGNNANGARTDLKIYKFALSEIPDYVLNPVVTIAANKISVINFTYSDQNPIVVVALADNKFDCEAMLIDNGNIHLFTKNWKDNNTSHYIINGLTAGSYVAAKTETLATNFLVTGADKVEGKNTIILLGYQSTGFANHYLQLLWNYSGSNFFSGNKRQLMLPNALTMGQAEGITFRNDTYGYISNEKVTTPVAVSSKLRSFNISTFIPSSLLALELVKFEINNVDGVHKISWDFTAPVNIAEVQYSKNGTQFTTIKAFNQSLNNVFNYTPSNSINYYRLAWKNNLTDYQYSQVVAIKNYSPNKVYLQNLSKNGRLTFNLQGNTNDKVAFKLVTTNGIILSAIPFKSFAPGSNYILFGPNKIKAGVAYVTYTCNGRVTTQLLQVSD